MAEPRTDEQRVRAFNRLTGRINAENVKLEALYQERNAIILALLGDKSERRVAQLTGLSRTMVQKIRMRSEGRRV